jgi:DNA repair protein RecO (recombination protein O)
MTGKTMRVTLQSAFILHHRPFRETSVLLDVFAEEHGLVSLIAKGVRTNRSKLKALLQPFVPLLVSWQGKSELMNLTSAEARTGPFQLRGDCLLSGFYINELLVRLLQKQDPHPQLFLNYQSTLSSLTKLPVDQSILRIFEKKLLDEIGYGLRWHEDFLTEMPLIPDKYYQYCPGDGFKETQNPQGFKGESLLAIANESLITRECLQDAKKLMRLIIAGLLGQSRLQSRELFHHLTE